MSLYLQCWSMRQSSNKAPLMMTTKTGQPNDQISETISTIHNLSKGSPTLQYPFLVISKDPEESHEAPSSIPVGHHTEPFYCFCSCRFIGRVSSVPATIFVCFFHWFTFTIDLNLHLNSFFNLYFIINSSLQRW